MSARPFRACCASWRRLAGLCLVQASLIFAAAAVEPLGTPVIKSFSEQEFEQLLLHELLPWLPAEPERVACAQEIQAWLMQWLGPPPYHFNEQAFAAGLRDQTTVLGGQSIAPDERPVLGLALLIGAAAMGDAPGQETKELRQQLQTLSAEAERHLYDRIRGAIPGKLPLPQSQLRAFIETRFEGQVVPYLEDPLWPMLKHPLSGREYRRLRETLLKDVYRIEFAETATAEDVLEEVAWIIRRLPGLAAQQRLHNADELTVQLDRGPARFVCTAAPPGSPEDSNAFFQWVLRAFGFPDTRIKGMLNAAPTPE